MSIGDHEKPTSRKAVHEKPTSRKAVPKSETPHLDLWLKNLRGVHIMYRLPSINRPRGYFVALATARTGSASSKVVSTERREENPLTYQDALVALDAELASFAATLLGAG